MSGTLDWQHPFVDIFKQFNVFEQATLLSKGSLTVIQDKQIGRRIIKLSGAISANNSITVTDPNTKTLGLTGRYVYIEFLVSGGKYFTLHLDFQIKGRDPTIRFTVSNLYENYKVSQNQLQIPYPKTNNEKWTILILDMEFFLSNFGILPLSMYQSFKGIHVMKQIQLCSTMSIKGIYTSDNLYDWQTMPKQMLFKLPKGAQWSEAYQIAYWPTQAIQPQIEKQPLQDVTSQILDNLMKIQQPLKHIPILQTSQKPAHLDELVKKRSDDHTLYTKAVDAPDHPLQPNPIMNLDRVLGFTVRSCPDIRWGRTSDSQGQVVYAGGNILIINNLNEGKQRFLMGHSQPVSCLDVAKDGQWIVSGQSGRNAVIRVWDYMNGECISAFATPYSDMVCASLSADAKMLVTSGLDDRNRETLIVWGLSGILSTRKPTLIAKQSATCNVISVKFSPTDNNRIISCGHENARFWRIKSGHLPGSCVVLDHHARNTTFGVFDFELGGSKRVFFGSKSGMLFQVGYASQLLEAVYKVHDQPISALCISAGFCVTGSKDQFLRVWPLDFSEFYIEARHEGIITSLDISLDGLQVVCGTSTGGLGVLDISSHSYRTIVRSHTARVLQLEIHEHSGLLVSMSEDCTIRLWDIQKSEQVYEFTFPSEDQCTVLSTHPKAMYFAAGFKSGILRVFDIENTSILEEARYHDCQIQHLTYNADGSLLVVSDVNSLYRIYDASRKYQPVKTLEQFIPSEWNCSAFSHDSEVLATVGDSGSLINLWSVDSWSILLRVFAANTQFKILRWAPNNIELVCGCAEGKVRIYGIERTHGSVHAYFLREQSIMHRGTLNSFAISQNLRFLLSTGGDPFVKVWDYEFSLKGPGSAQIMIGHQNSLSSVCMTQDGKTVISAGGDEGIFVWKFEGFSGKYKRALDLANYAPQTSQQQRISQQVEPQLPQEQQQLENEQEEQLDAVNQEDYNQSLQEDTVDDMQQQSLMRKTILSQPEQNIQVNNHIESKRIEQDFHHQTIQYKKINIPESPYVKRFNEEVINTQQTLPFKQFQPDKFDVIDILDSSNLISILSTQECHNSVVWCQLEGWVAWSVRNYVVIEYILERSQKLLQFQFKTGVLSLDPQQKYLLVGSAEKQDQIAPIVVVNTKNFIYEKRLLFHCNGIQQMVFTHDQKYLVSIGNHLERTVAIWDWPNGKLLSNTYTLDKLNEVKCSLYSFSDDRKFEFCTVGRDQIHFWALSSENVLEYYDVYLERNVQTGKLEEITSFDFIYFSRSSITTQTQTHSKKEQRQITELKTQNVPSTLRKSKVSIQPNISLDDVIQCIVLGLQSGEIVLLTYGDFKFVHRKRVCSGEITGIVVGADLMVIVSTDNVLVIVDLKGVKSLSAFISALDSVATPTISRIRLPGSPVAFDFEPMLQQGVITFKGGNLCIVGVGEGFISPLGAAMKRVSHAIAAGDVFVTVEGGKSVRFWDYDGQMLSEFDSDYEITAAFYDKHMNSIVAFTKGQVRVMKLDCLDTCEVFNYDGKQYEDVQIKNGFCGYFDGAPLKLIVGNNDSLYSYEQTFRGNEQLITLKKVLEYNNLDDIVIHSEKRTIFIIERDTGTVNTLLLDYNSDRDFNWGFTLIDVCDFKSTPHGILDSGYEQEASRTLYKDIKMKTQVVVGTGFEGLYFSILDGLQYVYCRNYLKQQVVMQIGLSDFPMCLIQNGSGQSMRLFVGMKNSYQIIEPREKAENVLKNTHIGREITQIIVNKQRIVCISEEGGCVYRI